MESVLGTYIKVKSSIENAIQLVEDECFLIGAKLTLVVLGVYQNYYHFLNEKHKVYQKIFNLNELNYYYFPSPINDRTNDPCLLIMFVRGDPCGLMSECIRITLLFGVKDSHCGINIGNND